MINRFGSNSKDSQGRTLYKVKCVSSSTSRVTEGNSYLVAQHDVTDAYEVYDLKGKYIEAAYKYRFSEPTPSYLNDTEVHNIKDFK